MSKIVNPDQAKRAGGSSPAKKLRQMELQGGKFTSCRIVKGRALVLFADCKTDFAGFLQGTIDEADVADVIQRTVQAFERCRGKIEKTVYTDDKFKAFALSFLAAVEEKVTAMIAEKRITAASAMETILESLYHSLLATSVGRKTYKTLRDLLITVLNEKNQAIGDIKDKIAAIKGPVIVFCKDLPQTETGLLMLPQVVGLVRSVEGQDDHTTITLRSLNKIGVVGLNGYDPAKLNGSKVILNGKTRKVIVNPSSAVSRQVNTAMRVARKLEGELAAERSGVVETLDGFRVYLGLNIDDPIEASLFSELAYSRVSLVRLERFLAFHEDGNPRTSPPELERQIYLFDLLLQGLSPGLAPKSCRDVCFRTPDIDDDKTLPYLELSEEERREIKETGFSAYLDENRVKLYFLFHQALEALLGVSRKKTIIFPNLFHFSDFSGAMAVVDRVAAKLGGTERLMAENAFGIMVEHPQIIEDLRALAENPEKVKSEGHPSRLGDLSLLSIGTGDLAERLTGSRRRGQARYTQFHPKVISAVWDTVKIGGRLGVEVSLCGNLGNNPLALPLLIGMGLRSFILSPDFVDVGRYMIRHMEAKACQQLLLGIEGATTPDFLQQIVKGFIQRKIENGWHGLAKIKDYIF